MFPSPLPGKSLNNTALVISGPSVTFLPEQNLKSRGWNSEVSWQDLLCEGPEFDFLQHTYENSITVFLGKTVCVGVSAGNGLLKLPPICVVILKTFELSLLSDNPV